MRFSIWLWMALGSCAGIPAVAQRADPAQAAKASGLTVNGVIEMVQAGLSDDVVIARLRRERKPFDLSADDMVRLKRAKVSDAVLKAMLDPGAPTAPSNPAAPAPPPPPPFSVSGPPGAAPAPDDDSGSLSPSPEPSQPHKGFFHGILDAAKKGATEGIYGPGRSAPDGPKAVDAAGLRNILPTFDHNKPVSQQFPHVAVTIVKAPPMWADTYLQSISAASPDGHRKGCFALKAVVWSDETHSRQVDPFNWCSPKDIEITPGARYADSMLPTMADRMSDYSTGITRTEGPRPPDTLAPTDRATEDLQARNGRNGAGDLNEDISSLFALMFANLRYAMGETLGEGDFRVWIVSIH